MAVASDFKRKGSSPRVRGKVIRRLHRSQRHRIIPAGAGKSISCAV